MPAPKGHPPYPGCETGGRPTYWTTERIEEEADALMGWLEDPDSWWFLDFAVKRKIPKELISKLAKRNEKFRQAYVMARLKQESNIGKGCLNKKLDGNFGWRFLSANYKYKEETDTSGLEDENAPASVVEIAKAKKAALEYKDSLGEAGAQPH